jgi:hypothetical protein
MADERERRLALNEAAFRVANERVAAWPERREHDEPAAYYCECANLECRAKLMLTRAEYERVRSDPMQFVVVDGHAIPDVESVVERAERFSIVAKHPGVRILAEGTDPRSR